MRADVQARNAKIVEMAKKGYARPTIAREVGINVQAVYTVISQARVGGADIPRVHGYHLGASRSPRVLVDKDVFIRLNPVAAERQITTRELISQILHVVARENLTDAILDDGDRDE
ncbi:hypothetical protein SAMN05421853_10283 [Roseivivax halotolerans]|uniref:Homeodomain-like domain-containing protein n=1 Tax=Roseivivax halotolerans TaxID=93684 RepID=A0A1I5W2B8_9RHOB|nr:helix-turn-helix domain-containing protein [Roseivivax halotolerans]SFQ13830.1 hypothetical protein SAMN05421853_10283 [Roseivivax halotolerans]